jgi:hypothetical protein
MLWRESAEDSFVYEDFCCSLMCVFVFNSENTKTLILLDWEMLFAK